MKIKFKQITFLTAFTLILISCGGKTKETAFDETETKLENSKFEWVDIDLSSTKLKYPIIVKGRKDCKISENWSDLIELENDDMIMNYQIGAYLAGIDQEMMDNSKKLIKESDAYKFEKFIIDKSDSYIIKTSTGYMVGRFIKAGSTTYECSMIPLYAIENEADAQELYKMMGMLKAK